MRAQADGASSLDIVNETYMSAPPFRRKRLAQARAAEERYVG
jgi:hypothetical protein